jgi:hypothetical protein
MRSMFGIAAIACLSSCGCQLGFIVGGPGVQGSGVIKEETREVTAFSGIDVGSAFSATVAIGSKPSLTLRGDDNILPLVETEVRDGVLVARIKKDTNYGTRNPIRLTITAPRIESIKACDATKVNATLGQSKSLKIEAADASTVEVAGIDSEAIELKARDASRVTLAGRAKGMTLTVSDASTIKAADLPVESVSAKVSDASKAEVRASGSIAGNASDASSIRVLGDPATRSVKTSDASSISYVSGRP